MQKQRNDEIIAMHKRHNEKYDLEKQIGIKKPLFKEDTNTQRNDETIKLGFCSVERRKEIYKDDTTTQRLKIPKEFKSSQNVFENSNFRGLIIADYQDSLKEIKKDNEILKVQSAKKEDDEHPSRNKIRPKKTRKQFPTPGKYQMQDYPFRHPYSAYSRKRSTTSSRNAQKALEEQFNEEKSVNYVITFI